MLLLFQFYNPSRLGEGVRLSPWRISEPFFDPFYFFHIWWKGVAGRCKKLLWVVGRLGRPIFGWTHDVWDQWDDPKKMIFFRRQGDQGVRNFFFNFFMFQLVGVFGTIGQTNFWSDTFLWDK